MVSECGKEALYPKSFDSLMRPVCQIGSSQSSLISLNQV